MLNGDNCDLTYFKKAFEYCDIPLSQEYVNRYYF